MANPETAEQYFSHYSDCAIYGAPAKIPAPCDCGYEKRLEKQIGALRAKLYLMRRMAEYMTYELNKSNSDV